MKEFLKKAIPYITTAIVGLIIFIIIICTKKIWDEDETYAIMQILSDACFVPGVLLAGFGLIIVASNGGVFDMLAYAMIKFFDLFKRDPRNKKYKDYYEYSESKKDRKRKTSFMLIVGAVFIVLAVIFLIVYYRTKP